MTATVTIRGAWRGLRAGTLLVWLLLPLLGCGSTLQAEDATTVAMVQRARALYDQGEYAAAKEKASLAVNRSPDNPQARYVRGLANLKLNEFALAREDLERAQQIDPLAMFAASKQEFDTALQTSIENTAEALGDSLTTPPAPDKPAAKPDEQPSDQPVDKPKPEPTDPVAKALAVAGPVMEDRSGQGVLGEPQKRSMNKIVQGLSERGLTVKFLVLAPGVAPEAEAQRLATAAGLGSRDLLILAQPPNQVVGYTATLTPEAIRAEIAAALADAGDASLARRMILAASAVGTRLQLPPEPPPAEGEQPAVPPPSRPALTPDRVTTPPLEPAQPTPTPGPGGLPLPTIALAAAGVVAVLLVWTILARLLARRRLVQGFAAASPHLLAVAERLSVVGRRLLTKSDRAAAGALAAAELAYFDAVAMMAAADDADTGDIARVERAERLLDEADAKLVEAEERLAPDVAPAAAAEHYCWFTAKPLCGRWNGDLVRLTMGEETRLVLAARDVGAAIRRGETPLVRAVDRDGRLVHWAEAADFEPLEDYYRTDRCGWHRVPPQSLGLDLAAAPARPLYLESDERPDFTVTL